MAHTHTISGAHIIINTLKDHAVNMVFGYPGGAVIPLYDALFDYRDTLRHVLVRHEQAAAHAATGYARTTGKTGVCIATSGPGSTNLMTGIADAYADSVPLVCITGQVPSSLLGTQAFQEVPTTDIARPITKWCTQVTKPEDIAYAIKTAFRKAREGRPGPVLVDITKDAQTKTCDYTPHAPHASHSSSRLPQHTRRQLVEAARLLNAAQRPFIIAGHGVVIADAAAELTYIADRGSIPVGCTLHGLPAMPASHPFMVGMLGMHGSYAANKLTNEADVILAIGARFGDRVTGTVATYAPRATIIHIDIDATQHGRVVQTTLPIIADAKAALHELAHHITRADRSDWHDRFQAYDAEEHATVRTHDLHPTDGALTMGEVVRRVSERTGGSAIVVADVGQHQMTTARYYGCESPRSFITSGGIGTMGFALPASIGAKIGNPHREVIAVMGDGSFQMNIQELGTIMQEQIPVKMVILNNGYLGMVRQWQELFHDKRYSCTELMNPDFARVAQAYGITAETITERMHIDEAIERLLTSSESYLLDVRVRAHDNVFPMIPAGMSVSDVRLR